MAPETLTASAESIVSQAEQEALERVAQREGQVTDVQEEHRKVVVELFEEQVDNDAELEEAPDMETANNQIDAMATEREGRFHDGVQVANLPGNIAGVEQDGDRSVRIDTKLASVEADEGQVKEVDNHEFRHTQQESGDDGGPVASTGNQEVDEILSLGSTEYRERDAMDFAGDEHTSQQYTVDYKEPVEAAAAYLNAHGEDGDRLIEEAGLNGKVAEIRTATMRAHVREEMERSLALAA